MKRLAGDKIFIKKILSGEVAAQIFVSSKALPFK